MRTAGVLLALGGAIALQTMLAGMTIGGGATVNLVLVAVVYVALAFGPVTGMLAGTGGGLLQDALAGGVVGIGSLSKTVVGFAVGVLGAQFIVSQPLPRLVMFFGATLVHELCFEALYALVETRAPILQLRVMFAQAGLNAIVGVIAFQIVEAGPGLLQRRQARRGSLSSRRF